MRSGGLGRGVGGSGGLGGRGGLGAAPGEFVNVMSSGENIGPIRTVRQLNVC